METRTLPLATFQTNLDEIAAGAGVTVRSAALPHGRWGFYDHRHRLITLAPDLAPAQYRSTLAHELGHAILGHIGTRPKQERQADRWAARQLLTVDLVVEHATLQVEVTELAHRLDVMPWVLEAFADTLTACELRSMLEAIHAKQF
jgi:Zn-dependent peptidase ImmA (M78 family)